MQCKSCAARLPLGSRFCHMCARPLTDGGSVKVDFPQADSQMWSSVSLATIGVRSKTRIWIYVALAMLLFAGLGAAAMWIGLQGSEANDSEAALQDADMELGDPLPEGVDSPEVDFISGGVHRARGAKAKEYNEGSEAQSDTKPSVGTKKQNGPSAKQQHGANSEGGSASVTSTGDTNNEATGEFEPERDIALDLYGAQVRRVIRQYYAKRAQSCFDRASRNNEALRGTVVVAFSVAADGQVQNAKPVRNTTGDEALGRCLASQVGSWRLPAPPGGALELEMPFSR